MPSDFKLTSKVGWKVYKRVESTTLLFLGKNDDLEVQVEQVRGQARI